MLIPEIYPLRAPANGDEGGGTSVTIEYKGKEHEVLVGDKPDDSGELPVNFVNGIPEGAGKDPDFTVNISKELRNKYKKSQEDPPKDKEKGVSPTDKTVAELRKELADLKGLVMNAPDKGNKIEPVKVLTDTELLMKAAKVSNPEDLDDLSPTELATATVKANKLATKQMLQLENADRDVSQKKQTLLMKLAQDGHDPAAAVTWLTSIGADVTPQSLKAYVDLKAKAAKLDTPDNELARIKAIEAIRSKLPDENIDGASTKFKVQKPNANKVFGESMKKAHKKNTSAQHFDLNARLNRKKK